MKDAGKSDELDGILAAWRNASIETLSATLHQDFVAFGREDGLFVKADRHTFLTYAKISSMHLLAQAGIRSCDVHGALATACLTHDIPGARRNTVLTMLKSGQGWQVMTAIFVVVDVVA